MDEIVLGKELLKKAIRDKGIKMTSEESLKALGTLIDLIRIYSK